MTLPQIIEEVRALEKRLEATPAGAPTLAAIHARIDELEGELARAESVLGPLVPNASNPPTLEQQTAAHLAKALRSLAAIVDAKQA